ncbi:MAG: ATP-binding protein [Candidatus Omnitrophota bacterium]|nr:ATP-binding protein [Candidatus Omnitrophota bacterium]
MLQRSLFDIAFAGVWGRQMRFITGPRQSGKTTLAKMKLKEAGTQKLYYLWDLRSVRNRYKASELFFTSDSPAQRGAKLWVCFDEIHKVNGWKNILKGIFDATQEHYQFIVTGSSKLDILRQAGDSLSGRYFTFQLLPLSLREVIGQPRIEKSECNNPLDFILEQMNRKDTKVQKALEQLLAYSGFPEPFLAGRGDFQKKWSRDYLERVITEDIGLLTRIADREKLHDLYELFPEMIGSPISENSLASHLESNPVTIKNYLRKLQDFYLAFKIMPYSRNIKRALLKASKWYLYDWTRIKDPHKRFENYIAVELNSRLSAWQDLTGTEFSLSYIRDKNKQETDFLILKERKPWLMVEAKYSDVPIENHHIRISNILGGIPIVQVCFEDNVASQEKKNAFRLSASRFLL